MDPFAPQKSDLFSFGLWTVGNPGHDPFGEAVRPVQDPNHLVRMLAECGAYGVNLHDNDLIPFGASAGERDRIVREFQQTLKDTGMVVPMATTNLFSHPVFKDGAFSANDPKVRAFALQKTMAAIDLGVELGASIYVFWGGREGTEADACRDPRTAIARMREALDFLCGYVKDQGYDLRFALEAKPNEPRSEIYLPTTGHMLHFISTLQHHEMVGVNPEVAHEVMSGLSFAHSVAQAMEAGKLFHIDLNGQKIGRYDQDLRFGSEDQKGALLLVRLLEGTMYIGPRGAGLEEAEASDARPPRVPAASSADAPSVGPSGVTAKPGAGGERQRSPSADVHSSRPEDPAARPGAGGERQRSPSADVHSSRPYYDGPRHFDAHAYRTEDEAGVWEFARGCMRTYNILRARARAFDADPEVRELIAEQRDAQLSALLTGGYSADKASKLRGLDLDPAAVARRGLGYERLDQLLIEHLLGVRG